MFGILIHAIHVAINRQEYMIWYTLLALARNYIVVLKNYIQYINSIELQ